MLKLFLPQDSITSNFDVLDTLDRVGDFPRNPSVPEEEFLTTVSPPPTNIWIPKSLNLNLLVIGTIKWEINR